MEKGKIDMELIRRYIRGELTPREMYALERQAQADPMLIDIILGMEEEALAVHDDNLADIRKRIADRTGQRRATTRRLATAQRWANAASILAVLWVGTWWFIREDTVVEQQREAIAAAAPQEALPSAAEDAVEDTSPAAPRRTAAAKAVAKDEVRKEERLAAVTPKPDTGADLRDSLVEVAFGTQQKAKIVGVTSLVAAARMDSPVVVNQEALAGRPGGLRIRGIAPAPTEEARARPIIGKVVNEVTQEPLEGVSIKISDEQTVATDKQGRFAAIDTSTAITAQYVGYQGQTIRITGSDSIRIALQPHNVSLSEVVVVGYQQGQPQDAQVNHTTSQPTPKQGWPAYRQYLQDAAKLAPIKKGTVDLSFTVDDDGKPTDIKVIKSTDTELDKFVTLIVRDGPRWAPGANNARKVTLRVAF